MTAESRLVLLLNQLAELSFFATAERKACVTVLKKGIGDC